VAGGEGVDPLDEVRAELSELDDRPVDQHVPVLARALDAMVRELDELARSIPPAR
jgi:hypothetical protein